VLKPGPITDAYVNAGGLSSGWGVPIAEVGSFTGANGSGVKQNFTAGQVLNSASGTFLVPNQMIPTWGTVDWIRGRLGWPTGPASCSGGSCTQSFQGGTITAPNYGAIGTITYK